MTELDLRAQAFAIKIYESVSRNNVPRVMEHWHASSLAQCPRAQFYARKKVEVTDPVTAGKLLRFATGHMVEAVVRPHIKGFMPNVLSNVRFRNMRLDLTGELDNYDPDSKTIWEVKSIHPNAVKYRKVADDRHHVRDEHQYLHHEWQNHAYVLLMAQDDTEVTYDDGATWQSWEPIRVERIGYLYVSLSGLLVPYLTDVSQDILVDVEDRITRLNDFYQMDKLPPCFCGDHDHKFYKPVMQYCDYKTESGCCEESLYAGRS